MKAPYAEVACTDLRLARMKYGITLSYPLRVSLQALTRPVGTLTCADGRRITLATLE